jgi:hypothetical protein
MGEFEQRHQAYRMAADRLMHNVIRPRLQKLAEHFDNARFPEPEQDGRDHQVCLFERTPRFLATASLELAVSRDGQFETVLLLSTAKILPVFFPFQGDDRLAMPLGRVSEEQAAAWAPPPPPGQRRRAAQGTAHGLDDLRQGDLRGGPGQAVAAPDARGRPLDLAPVAHRYSCRSASMGSSREALQAG